MKTLSRNLAFLLLYLPLVCHAEGETYLGDIPAIEAPLRVRMGFNLSNITDVNAKEETVDIDGAIFLLWKDERLSYDPASVGYPEDYQMGDYSQAPRKIFQGDFAVKEIFTGWRPHVIIQNGIGDRSISNLVLGIWPDGTVSYGEGFHAKVETPMDLRRFPFDKQNLKVHIQPLVYRRNQLVLVPDENLSNTWEHEVGIAQWKNEGFSFEENIIEMKSMGGEMLPKSEIIATLNIKRLPQHFLLSTILPLIVLVCLSWIVFWMDEESMTDRINVSFIGILSVVAYYFVIQDHIPNISYVTLIDSFIILTFFTLATTVLISVVVDKMNKAGRVKDGDKLDRICRWAFPGFYFSMSMIIGLIFFIIT